MRIRGFGEEEEEEEEEEEDKKSGWRRGETDPEKRSRKKIQKKDLEKRSRKKIQKKDLNLRAVQNPSPPRKIKTKTPTCENLTCISLGLQDYFFRHPMKERNRRPHAVAIRRT
ncbi:hypothetical protein H6P81_018611 [Aristolochia fimbriata]|uniref:Uncharacterized protein n=1 Tax=Aristolochia fimbriata TaxID=158543 RepID=A0AAV7E4M0_ARIFI|nr:hypothetical protein H6P81_018611 [Aristolochia fimbriata]